MKKLTVVVMLLVLSSLFSACMTSSVWEKNSIIDKKTTFQVFKEDYIKSFGKVIQKNQNPQFIVIGTDNAYLIDGDTQKINRLLDLKTNNVKLEMITDQDNSLVLEIKPEQKDNYDFKAVLNFKIIISEPTSTQKELWNVESKALNAYLVEKEHELILNVNIPIQGKIILLDDKLKALDHQDMSKKYKVKIGYYATKKSLDGGQLLGNIIQTPLALIADAIIIPLASIAFVGDTILRH